MSYVMAVFVVLVLLPLIMAILFRGAIVDRKENEILEDLKKLRADETELVIRKGGTEAIKKDIQNYYGRRKLLVPVILLTIFYAFCFLFSWSYVNVTFDDGLPAFFSKSLLRSGRPVMMSFVGAYLFNTGTLIRRLYLADLTEHVFWTSINRFLLTMGLSVLLVTAFSLGDGDAEFAQFYFFIFFFIGFLANEYLLWGMERAIRLLKFRQLSALDLPLQTIQGINIWKEYRLEEEGIENVQNLATADIIDLAIKTHFNLRTLLDWIDQAILLDRFGEQTRVLREKTLFAGAIDLAWQSPEFTGDDTTARLIGEKLGLDPHFVTKMMNSLFEDAYVQTLWQLWQTRPEVPPDMRAAA